MSTFRTSYYKFLNPTETMKFYFERNAPILNSNMHIIKIQYWGVLSRVSLLFITHEKNLWNSSFSVNKFYRLWYNFIISRNGKVLIDIIAFEHEVLWLLDDYGKISYCLTPQVPGIYLHRNHAFSTQTRHILAFYDRTTLLLRSYLKPLVVWTTYKCTTYTTTFQIGILLYDTFFKILSKVPKMGLMLLYWLNLFFLLHTIHVSDWWIVS